MYIHRDTSERNIVRGAFQCRDSIVTEIGSTWFFLIKVFDGLEETRGRHLSSFRYSVLDRERCLCKRRTAVRPQIQMVICH